MWIYILGCFDVAEVVKVLKAKKYAKMKKTDSQKQSLGCEVEVEEEEAESEERKNNQVRIFLFPS